VLQVAVGHAELAQVLHQGYKTALEVAQRGRLRQVGLDRAVQRIAVDPGHLGDRVPGLADAHACVQVLDRHQRSAAQMRQGAADGRVARSPVGRFTMEAAHRPLLRACSQLVGNGEIASDRTRQPKRPDGGRCRAQLWVRERRCGVLDHRLIGDEVR
jgi:hypothetical protein